MGKYEELQDLAPEQFKRLTGVKKETFEEMIKILVDAQNSVYRRAGRRGELSLEDKLLMALEYLGGPGGKVRDFSQGVFSPLFIRAVEDELILK